MPTVSTTATPQPAAPTPLLGQKTSKPRKAVGRLGPWQLLRSVGEGATSRVYLARPGDGDASSGAYAVKSLRREFWNDAHAIEAQRREAWVGGRVNSAHLAPVLASGVDAPPYYTVTPFLSGSTAATLLAEGRPLALPVALWIARQTAEALAALWRDARMIHGDVKPANLIVGPDGHTTLIDLGGCQSVNEARSWVDRPLIGTLRYMAPERITSTATVDRRSDLYSLGATLYELIAGRPPHDADSPAALIERVRTERPECLRKAAPTTPKPAASLVHRLLAKDPLRRPATPEEVVDELAPLEIACFAMR